MKRIFLISAVILLVFNSFRQPTPNPAKASIDRGKKVYQTACMACHQIDGEGIPRMAPTLVKTKWVLGSKKELIKIVLKGLRGGEIEIDGDTFHNAMPPQELTLNDQQIADVLTYVRNSFGNKASVVTTAEVKTARAAK